MSPRSRAMNDTKTKADGRGGTRFEDRLLDELLLLHAELNPIAEDVTEPTPGRRHRRPGVRSPIPARLAASLSMAVALVVAVSVVTIRLESNKTDTGSTAKQFVTPNQTSVASWNLTGLVAASGWHPQSVGATSPLQLICPTEQTCIASGVDLGVDQSSLPVTQFDIEVSNDGGGPWRGV